MTFDNDTVMARIKEIVALLEEARATRDEAHRAASAQYEETKKLLDAERQELIRSVRNEAKERTELLKTIAPASTRVAAERAPRAPKDPVEPSAPAAHVEAVVSTLKAASKPLKSGAIQFATGLDAEDVRGALAVLRFKGAVKVDGARAGMTYEMA